METEMAYEVTAEGENGIIRCGIHYGLAEMKSWAKHIAESGYFMSCPVGSVSVHENGGTFREMGTYHYMGVTTL